MKYRKSIHTIVDTGVKIYFACLEFSLYAEIPYDITVSSYLSTSFEYSLITFHSIKELQDMTFMKTC